MNSKVDPYWFCEKPNTAKAIDWILYEFALEYETVIRKEPRLMRSQSKNAIAKFVTHYAKAHRDEILANKEDVSFKAGAVSDYYEDSSLVGAYLEGAQKAWDSLMKGCQGCQAGCLTDPSMPSLSFIYCLEDSDFPNGRPESYKQVRAAMDEFTRRFEEEKDGKVLPFKNDGIEKLMPWSPDLPEYLKQNDEELDGIDEVYSRNGAKNGNRDTKNNSTSTLDKGLESMLAKNPALKGKTVLRNALPIKMSEVLLEYAQPLLDGVGENKTEFVNALKMAMVVWNYEIMTEEGKVTDEMRMLFEYGLMDKDSKEIISILQERKKKLFPDIKHTIADFKLQRIGDRYNLVVLTI